MVWGQDRDRSGDRTGIGTGQGWGQDGVGTEQCGDRTMWGQNRDRDRMWMEMLVRGMGQGWGQDGDRDGMVWRQDRDRDGGQRGQAQEGDGGQRGQDTAGTGPGCPSRAGRSVSACREQAQCHRRHPPAGRSQNPQSTPHQQFVLSQEIR